MDPDADLASVAALMADKHRAQMLLTLLGGTPMSGSALAEAAGISRSLASAHLKKLVAGGLVRAQPSGRQQLYSIASEPVADALEVLILLAPATKVRSLGDASRARSLRWARMCYDHLGGVVVTVDQEAGDVLNLRPAGDDLRDRFKPLIDGRCAVVTARGRLPFGFEAFEQLVIQRENTAAVECAFQRLRIARARNEFE